MPVQKKTETTPEAEVAELKAKIEQNEKDMAELKAMIQAQANAPVNIIAKERKPVVTIDSRDHATIQTKYV